MDNLTITPILLNQSDNKSDSQKDVNGDVETPCVEAALVDEKKVTDLLIDWMNVLPATKIIERARLLKLAAGVDDADEVIVCNLILFKDILDTQLKQNLLNADKRYDKRLKAIDREYQRKRSQCTKKHQNEKRAMIENAHKTLRQNKGSALMEELYKKSIDTTTSQSEEQRNRRRNHTIATTSPFIVYELDEKDAEEDVEQLRRSTAERTANKLLNCLIEDSVRKMRAQLNK